MTLGTNLTIVAYQGGSPAFNAIMRDEVQLLFPTTVASRPFIVNNQVRPYAVTTQTRVPLYPDVPTLKELGLDVTDSAGFGLMGPKGMAPEIVKTVHEALMAEIAKPEIKAFLNDLGLVIVAGTPEHFAATLKQMTAQWADLAAKLKLEKQ